MTIVLLRQRGGPRKGVSVGAALITGGIFWVASFAAITADKAAPLNNIVRERQPVLTELSANASAMTYWVSESDAWHVVTTVDIVGGHGCEVETHAVVRFSSGLLPGQSQLISVPPTISEQHKEH